MDAQLFDLDDVAGLFKVSVKTVRRLVDRGELECLRVGQQIRFRREHVESYLAGEHVAAGDDDDWT